MCVSSGSFIEVCISSMRDLYDLIKSLKIVTYPLSRPSSSGEDGPSQMALEDFAMFRWFSVLLPQ